MTLVCHFKDPFFNEKSGSLPFTDLCEMRIKALRVTRCSESRRSADVAAQAALPPLPSEAIEPEADQEWFLYWLSMPFVM